MKVFLGFPKKETKGKLPLLITLHGGGGKSWSIEEQLKRSAKVKGLALAELAGKDLILLEPNSFKKWDPKTSERFAAAAPGGFSGVSEHDDFAKLVNFPVYGMVGGEDGKNVASVKKMTTLLKAAGNKNVEYIAFPGANHPQGNKKLFSHVDCIDWMLKFSSKN